MIGGITKEGLKMIQETVGTGERIQFTTFKLGSDYPTTTENYEDFKDLGEQKLEIPVYRTSYLTPYTVQNSAHLTLQHLKESFVFHELGVYARVGGTEPRLYAYYYKTEGEVLDANHYIERTLAVETFVSTASSVQITIDNSVEWINKREFNAHLDDGTNPHNVTKEQVGLSFVENLRCTTTQDLSLDPSKTYLTHIVGDKLVSKYLKAHLDSNNPHNITAETVGLELVSNYPVATTEDVQKPTAELPTNKYTTPSLVTYQTLQQIRDGYYLLSLFSDYEKLLQKEQLESSPNIEIVPTNTGLKIVYTGNTGTTIGWNDIISGNFEQHPDVKSVLAKYIKTVASSDRSVTITKKDDSIDLSVNFKPHSFEDLEGDPLSNSLLSRLLESKLEEADIFNSDDIIKEPLQGGGFCFKLNSSGKPITWKDLTGSPQENLTLTEYIKSLSLEPSEIKKYFKAGTNVSITELDGVLTINAVGGGGSGPVDLSNYYTKQEVDQRLEGKIGILEEIPQLPTTNKTVVGAVGELDTRLDAAAVLIQNQDKEIEDLKKGSLEGKLNVIASLQAKHPQTAVTESSTYMEICNGILNIPSGTGFVPMEFGESTFPMMYQVGTSNINYQIGGNVAVASYKNHLLIFKRTKEFNWRFSKISFDSTIQVIRVSPYGKYICVGRSDVWQVFNSETLEQEYELRTFNTAIPCFTWDEVHFCYFSDAQSLQCYNLKTKVIDKLIKSSAYRLEFMKNDLSGYVTNKYYYVNNQNNSEESSTQPVPRYFIEDRMFALQETNLVECKYVGVDISTEVKVESINNVKMSQSHIFCYNSGTPKTYRVFDTTFKQLGKTYAGTEMPQYVFGEYGIKMNGATPKLFYPDKEINPFMTINHNYAYDLTCIYYKDQNGNKAVKFRRDGTDFVFDSYLPATPPVSDVKCSPNGKVVMVYGNINELFENGLKVERTITRGNWIPLDNKDYYINGQYLWKWNGKAYAQSTNLMGNTFDRQLKYALPSTGSSVYLIEGESVTELPLGMALSYGSLGIDMVYSGTEGYYARLDYASKQAYLLNIPGKSKASRCGDGILLALVGYSYGDFSGAIASCNPLFTYTDVCGQTLFGSGTVTTLISLS